MKNLQTMPGVREQSATQIIAEIGVNMRMFLTAAMLVGLAGVKPRNDKSNKKLKSRSITHGNKYLKKLMVECARGLPERRDVSIASSATTRHRCGRKTP